MVNFNLFCQRKMHLFMDELPAR